MLTVFGQPVRLQVRGNRVVVNPMDSPCPAAAMGLRADAEDEEMRLAQISLMPRPPTGMSFIYAVRDPTDDRVLYVGQTSNRPIERLRGHESADTPLGQWLRAIKPQVPRISIESVCASRDAHQEEGRLIMKYGGLGALFNSAPPVANLMVKKTDEFHRVADRDDFHSRIRALVEKIPPLVKKRCGRPPVPMPEKAFCSILKVYSGLSCRKALSLFNEAYDNNDLTNRWGIGTTSKFLNEEDSSELLDGLLKMAEADYGTMADADIPYLRSKNPIAAANEEICWKIGHLLATGSRMPAPSPL